MGRTHGVHAEPTRSASGSPASRSGAPNADRLEPRDAPRRADPARSPPTRAASAAGPPRREWRPRPGRGRRVEELDGTDRGRPRAIRAATFTVEAVDEREQVTDHDVAAFVDVLAASAGAAGRWIHYGLTSSDVLDTALALQLRARR